MPGTQRRRVLATYAIGMAVAMLAAARVAAEDGIVHPAHPADAHAQRPATRISCMDCHRCEHPSPEDPCLVDCPRHAQHFYGSHAADEGPEIVIIDQLAHLYRPVVFAHRVHANMSAMSGGCENCHHYSEQSGKIPPCRDCHDETRHTTDLRRPALKGAYHRQCINCHLDWSHENACGFCHEEAKGSSAVGPAAVDKTDIVGILHPQITAPPTYTYETSYEDGPLVTFHHQDHVDAFGQACVDCHRGDSCGHCHDATTSAPARIDHVKTCCTCHSERDCGFCHTQEAQPMFHHTESVEWPLSRFHESVGCTVCHGDPGEFHTPERRCVSCHIHWDSGEGFDHAVTGLVLNEDHVDSDCSDCHQDMEFIDPPTCDECHDDEDEIVFPDELPGERVPSPPAP